MKMKKSKILAAFIATSAALTVGGVALGSGSASAATYNGVCGPGYSVIDHHDLDGGTIFLTYNNGWNCVVTVRNQPGQAEKMLASLNIFGSSDKHRDSGWYTTYAGPVFVNAPHQCVDWGGGITPPGYENGGVWNVIGGHCG
ncbi:hypothetical protein ACQP2U_24015 [Nocardia sp. CA-084685]|uniref:hypothetical protein n=1 Tax=Nocardia sp. CA-084685 TaxID=3239970 RepID=UPI003D98C79F